MHLVRDEVLYRLALPIELVSPGEHVLTIRLGAGTKTTSRLKNLVIRRP